MHMVNERVSDSSSATDARCPDRLILLAGATGYVGDRLLRDLQARGYIVRCLARRPSQLEARVAAGAHVVQGDAVSGEGLADALRGVDTAFYLIHSMGDPGEFEERDRRAARNFGAAASAAGVRRIVYLGGLADEAQDLSAHLRSRIEVGRLLRESGVPVIELRASIVIGSGSLSFEMVRALVEHLPVMITPRWVSMRAQPIGIDDLLAYLREALHADPTGNPVYEIGGADQLSYGDLMREYARQRGLRRAMLRVPMLTPWLSSLWLGLVTPLYARVGRKLIDSIRHASVVNSDAARRDFSVVPTDIRTAISRALEIEDREFAETRWSDAVCNPDIGAGSFGGMRIGRRLVDSRDTRVAAPPARAFEPIRCIGGDAGWYACDALWRLRGFIDALVGGPGMCRGRRHPEMLAVGDVIDCWRVVDFEPDRALRLAADMRMPGRAWLEFEVSPDGDGSRIRQTAVFEPAGLAGLAYWYGVYPLHALVFRGMLRGLRERVEESAALGVRGAGGGPAARGANGGLRERPQCEPKGRNPM
jgi:uncharacterized protein YbjT (DUF2867 family)